MSPDISPLKKPRTPSETMLGLVLPVFQEQIDNPIWDQVSDAIIDGIY